MPLTLRPWILSFAAAALVACASTHGSDDGGGASDTGAARDAGPPPVAFHGCDDPRTWEVAADRSVELAVGMSDCVRTEAPLRELSVWVHDPDGGLLDGPVCVRVVDATEDAGLSVGDTFEAERPLYLTLPGPGQEVRLEARVWIDGRVAAGGPIAVGHDGAARLRTLDERPVAMVPMNARDAASMQPWLAYPDRIEGPDGVYPTEGRPLDLAPSHDRTGPLVLETSEAGGLRVRDPLRGDVWPVGPHDPDARFVRGYSETPVATDGWVRFPRSATRGPIELPEGAENLAWVRDTLGMTVDGTVRVIGGDPLEAEPPSDVDWLAPDSFRGTFLVLSGDRLVHVRRAADDPGLALPVGARAALGPVRSLFPDLGPLVIGERALAAAEPEGPTPGSRLVESRVALGGRVLDFAEYRGFAVFVVEADDGTLSLHAMLSEPIGCI